jgi:hypothetical protein
LAARNLKKQEEWVSGGQLATGFVEKGGSESRYRIFDGLTGARYGYSVVPLFLLFLSARALPT